MGAAAATPPLGGEVQSLGDVPSQARSSRTSRVPTDFRRRAALLVVEDAGLRTVRSEPGGGRCFEYCPGGREMKYRPPLGLPQALDRKCAAEIDARIPPSLVLADSEIVSSSSTRRSPRRRVTPLPTNAGPHREPRPTALPQPHGPRVARFNCLTGPRPCRHASPCRSSAARCLIQRVHG